MTEPARVLIIVGDATECVDTLYPYLRVQEEGFVPVVAGPDARRYQMVLHEIPEGWDITRETAGYTIEAEIAFRDVAPADYAGCVEGRRMACIPKCRFDLEVCGGTFVDAPCVVDGNLVSGRSWHDHGQYMKPWIEMLIAERERMQAST